MDIQYLLLWQNIREWTQNIFDSWFLFATSFGDDFLILLFLSGIYWCINKRAAFYVLFNFYTGNFVNQLIKVTACVYRPWIQDSRIIPVAAAKPGAGGYSFPSGHTAKATAAWGSLAAVEYKSSGRISWFLVSIILIVGISRNYLGVHTPQDVIVSLIIGVFLLFFTERILDWVDMGDNRDSIILLAGILLSIMLVLYARYKTYPLDYVDGVLLVQPSSMIGGCFKGSGSLAGVVAGWFWERRWIQFDETVGGYPSKARRFLWGGLFLTMLMKTVPGIMTMWLGRLKGAYAYGFFTALFITAIYPWCWCALKRRGARHEERT